MLPLVSVVVVGYDRFDLLQRTITSFLETTTYPRTSLELSYVTTAPRSPSRIECERFPSTCS